jgi:hypothetical protein
MNKIKRILGIVWIAIGAVAVYYLFINQALGMWKEGGEKLVPAIIYFQIHHHKSDQSCVGKSHWPVEINFVFPTAIVDSTLLTIFQFFQYVQHRWVQCHNFHPINDQRF